MGSQALKAPLSLRFPKQVLSFSPVVVIMGTSECASRNPHT